MSETLNKLEVRDGAMLAGQQVEAQLAAQESADYSQNKEQAIILDFFRGQPPGRFLELGAFDGIAGSNCRALSDRGWSGLCVEADARAFVKLLGNHSGNEKIQCLNAAVTRWQTNGVTEFYDAGEQMSTAWPTHKLGQMVTRKWHVGSINIPGLFKVFGFRWHFISIDIEGYDLEVIRAMKRGLAHTCLVCFEDSLPCTEFNEDYYKELLEQWAKFGFTKVVGRTTTPDGKPANTLLSRDPPTPVLYADSPETLKKIKAHWMPPAKRKAKVPSETV
jgi:FkbM family methyltransferase